MKLFVGKNKANRIADMVKRELVSKLAKKEKITKKEADLAVNTVFAATTASLSKGEKVELRGFGSFTVRNHAARTGRNPKTGQFVEVPSKKVPFFRTGKDLKIIS